MAVALIDSHAHLTSQPLNADIPAVLSRARAAGVDHVITIAVDMTDAERVVQLGRSEPCVSPAIGIHPHEAGKVTDADWTRYESFLNDPSIVAFGEMGLDYHYDFADRPTQRRVFERQLERVAATGRPIIIHARQAHEDTVAILASSGYNHKPVVFHCFSGNAAEAENIAEHGWRISFTGVVTFKNARPLQAVAAAYPIDQLMIETDSPYLSPVPVRHIKPNEPAHLAHVARFLADLRGISLDELAHHTSENTRTFFALPG